MTDPGGMDTFGQLVALLIIAAWCAGWVLVAARRAKVRDRQRMRRLAKVSARRGKVRE